MAALRITARRVPLSTKCLATVESPLRAPRRYASTATATQTSNAAPHVQAQVKKEAELPNSDPSPDSPTVAFLKERTPFMVPTYIRPAPVMVKGQGCYLWDMENRRYLDLTSGIAVNSLGHCDPEIAKLIAEQAETLIHASNLYHNPWTGALSKLLVDVTRQSGAMRDAGQVFISNSGTEANEAAIKFARKVGRSLDPSGAKHEFVSFHNSFHGRTMGALSATPNPKYQTPFSPMVPGFKYGTFNDVEQLESLITDSTCGVIVEPIQGEGGMHVATPEFLIALRQRCDAVGAVLIFDEIQCGLSRTGSLWAHAHPSLYPSTASSTSTVQPAHPDILTTAKALGNGLPIGATIISSTTIAPHILPGDHGTTFGGNPLSSRIAHHIVTRLADPSLQHAVSHKSTLFIKGFESLRQKFPNVISEIRGRGLILGVQLKEEYVPKVADFVTAARERGVLIITAGEGCLRFVPALTISEEQIEIGLRVLEKVVETMVRR